MSTTLGYTVLLNKDNSSLKSYNTKGQNSKCLGIIIIFWFRNCEETPSQVIESLKMLNSWIYWAYFHLSSSWVCTLYNVNLGVRAIPRHENWPTQFQTHLLYYQYVSSNKHEFNLKLCWSIGLSIKLGQKIVYLKAYQFLTTK